MKKISLKLLLSLMFAIISIVQLYGTEEKNSMSIFEYINKNMGKDGKFPSDKENLDFNNKAEYKIRIMPGNQDGFYKYYGSSENSEETAEKIGELIKRISNDNKAEDKAELYKLIRENRVITFIDELVTYSGENEIEINENLENLAEESAFHSDEIEIVKFGMFLKGLVGDKKCENKIKTLGKHNEFTLYAVVYLMLTKDNIEDDIWELAKATDGWGRIGMVDLLSKTENIKIKRWLLMEGYKNSADSGYSAYISANTGGLKDLLMKKKISEKELTVATEIIKSLVESRVSENIEDYEDGVDVVKRYLEIIKNRKDNLKFLIVADSINKFIKSDEYDWDKMEKIGWNTEEKENIEALTSKIITSPKWETAFKTAESKVTEENIFEFETVAEILKINLYDYFYNRTVSNPKKSTNWYMLRKYTDETNIDKTIYLANKYIDYKKAEGTPEMGPPLGPDYELYLSISEILQMLADYPNTEENIILAGLKSKNQWNRQAAIITLKKWGKIENNEIIEQLNKMKESDPDSQIKAEIETLNIK